MRCAIHPALTASRIPPRSHAVSLAILLLLVPFPGIAQRRNSRHLPAEEIVRRCLVADHTTNVRGKEIEFIEPPHMQSVNVVRSVVKSKDGWTLYRWEEPAKQRGMATLDDGQWTLAWSPGSRTLTSMRSAPDPTDAKTIARRVRLTMRNYRIKLDDMEPLAGRKCYIVSLTPISDATYSLRLWIDTRTFFMLGHQENNAQGHTIALTMYRWIDFPQHLSNSEIRGAIPSSAHNTVKCPSRVFSSIASLRRAAGFELCLPFSMPAGYEVERCELDTVNGIRAACVRYTNGICSLSIFQHPVREDRPSSFRAMRAYIHNVGDSEIDFAAGPTDFTLVGRIEMRGLMAAVRALNSDRERVLLADIAQTFHASMSAVGGLRDQGLGSDTIDALYEINAQTRRPLPDLVSLAHEGYCWRTIAQRCHARIDWILRRVKYFEAR